MAIKFSGRVELLNGQRDRVTDIIEQAGLDDHQFLIDVRQFPGKQPQVLVVNYDTVRSKSYRILGWAASFAKDVSSGTFAKRERRSVFS